MMYTQSVKQCRAFARKGKWRDTNQFKLIHHDAKDSYVCTVDYNRFGGGLCAFVIRSPANNSA